MRTWTRGKTWQEDTQTELTLERYQELFLKDKTEILTQDTWRPEGERWLEHFHLDPDKPIVKPPEEPPLDADTEAMIKDDLKRGEECLEQMRREREQEKP